MTKSVRIKLLHMDTHTLFFLVLDLVSLLS